MAVVGSTFIWDDQSAIANIDLPQPDNIDRPIYMTVVTADKGYEEWQHKVYGKDFYDIYGKNISFKRHGQPLLQAANIINAGGYLTIKRVVAEDATLANLVLVANLQKTTEQETDSNGVFLWQYTDPITGNIIQVSSAVAPSAGSGTIPAGVTVSPLMVDAVNLTFSLQSIAVYGNNLKAFVQAARTTYDSVGKPSLGSSGQYPLFLIADTGRGLSNKRFRIYAEDTSSVPVDYYRYLLEIYENGNLIETIPFTFNPNIIEGENNVSLQNAVLVNSKQVRARFFDDIYEDLIENLEYITNISDLTYKDIVFGKDEMQAPIPHFYTNGSPLLDSVFGNPLLSGSNGSFTDAPARLPHTSGMNIVDIAFKNAFSGNTADGDDIYDLDNNRVDCIFDANYHQEVKRAIEQLANFREDLVYFRDFGTEVTGIPQIKIIDSYCSHTRFCASYMNSYDIYDPFSRKQITVTVTYDLAALFVDHFINGRIRPFCGQKYKVIIPSQNFIKGTLNFSPKRTPSQDQRKIFDTMRINYLAYYDGNVLTMNSEYTSQTELTQLSWINNVLGTQEIIKAIRVLCPKIRYSFLDGDDLVQYRKDIQTMVIDKYADRFKECWIEYANDPAYDSNKIIYAVIYIKYRNFVQTEIFKITALQS